MRYMLWSPCSIYIKIKVNFDMFTTIYLFMVGSIAIMTKLNDFVKLKFLEEHIEFEIEHFICEKFYFIHILIYIINLVIIVFFWIL